MKKNGCLAMALLLLLVLGLSGCTAGVDKRDTDSSAATLLEDSQGEAEDLNNSTGEAGIQGIENNTLRRVDWMGINAMVDGGFFSLGYEVLPDESTGGMFATGTRLYYNDIATMQSRPLSLEDEPGGYLVKTTTSDYVEIFTTKNKLIVVNENQIETMNFDLTGREKLWESKSFPNNMYTDGNFLYVTEEIAQPDGRWAQNIVKLHLESGEYEELYELQESQRVVGTYENALIIAEPITDVTVYDGGTFSDIERYSTLDTSTGEVEELYEIDSAGKGILDLFVMNDRIFWRFTNEIDLYMYDPATDETKLLEISDKPYFHRPTQAWDGKMPYVSRRDDMSGYEYFYTDLTTYESKPLLFTVEKPELDFAELIEIGAEYEDYYIAQVDTEVGNMWVMEGETVTSTATSPYDDPNVLGSQDFTSDFTLVYAVINKEDYWAGKVEYVPFTIVVA